MFPDRDITCKRCLKLYQAHLEKSEVKIESNTHLVKAKAQLLLSYSFQALLGSCMRPAAAQYANRYYEKKALTIY